MPLHDVCPFLVPKALIKKLFLSHNKIVFILIWACFRAPERERERLCAPMSVFGTEGPDQKIYFSPIIK